MSTEEPDQETGPESFGHRHGVTILTVTLFGLLAFVMIIQMAC